MLVMIKRRVTVAICRSRSRGCPLAGGMRGNWYDGLGLSGYGGAGEYKRDQANRSRQRGPASTR